MKTFWMLRNRDGRVDGDLNQNCMYLYPTRQAARDAKNLYDLDKMIPTKVILVNAKTGQFVQEVSL